MAVKFPKKVRVNCFDYDIIYPYRFKEAEDRVAQHSYYNLEIRISPESPLRERRRDSKIVVSLIHELIHAIDYCYNFNTLEEDQVESLANVLFEFFTKNFNGKKWDVRDKLDILGHKYSIELGTEFEEIDDAASFAENNSCVICLASSINKPSMQRAYLLYHVFVILNRLVSIGIDESIIDRLAFAFIDTMDRNNLWKFFTIKG